MHEKDCNCIPVNVNGQQWTYSQSTKLFYCGNSENGICANKMKNILVFYNKEMDTKQDIFYVESPLFGRAEFDRRKYFESFIPTVCVSYLAKAAEPWTESLISAFTDLQDVPELVYVNVNGEDWSYSPVTKLFHCGNCINGISVKTMKGILISRNLDLDASQTRFLVASPLFGKMEFNRKPFYDQFVDYAVSSQMAKDVEPWTDTVLKAFSSMQTAQRIRVHFGERIDVWMLKHGTLRKGSCEISIAAFLASLKMQKVTAVETDFAKFENPDFQALESLLSELS